MTLLNVHFDGRALLLLLLVGVALAALLFWAVPADRRDRKEAIDRSIDHRDT